MNIDMASCRLNGDKATMTKPSLLLNHNENCSHQSYETTVKATHILTQDSRWVNTASDANHQRWTCYLGKPRHCVSPPPPPVPPSSVTPVWYCNLARGANNHHLSQFPYEQSLSDSTITLFS